jgi:hypothetical protein
LIGADLPNSPERLAKETHSDIYIKESQQGKFLLAFILFMIE